MTSSQTEHQPPSGALASYPPVRRYVVLLVHGTFAQNSPWTRGRSVLRQHVRQELSGIVTYKLFYWGRFNNSPAARRRAAIKLQEKLKKSLDRHPTAIHFIIAHSHGGNVALEALKEPTLASRVSAVICLATPYISAKPSNLSEIVIFLCFFVWVLPLGILTALLCFCTFCLVGGGLGIVSFVLTDWNLRLCVIAYLLWMSVKYMDNLISSVYKLWKGPLTCSYRKGISWTSYWASNLTKQYGMPAYPPERVLCVPANKDETHTWLRMLSAPAFVLRSLTERKIVSFFFSFAFLFALWKYCLPVYELLNLSKAQFLVYGRLGEFAYYISKAFAIAITIISTLVCSTFITALAVVIIQLLALGSLCTSSASPA